MIGLGSDKNQVAKYWTHLKDLAICAKPPFAQIVKDHYVPKLAKMTFLPSALPLAKQFASQRALVCQIENTKVAME